MLHRKNAHLPITVNSETTANWEVDSPERWNVPVNFTR
jgi:hypothetical protein